MSGEAPLAFESEWAAGVHGPVRQARPQGISDELDRTSGLFDVQDGTHAKWSAETLGVLTVFNTEEIVALLCAWEEAADGNWLAQKEVLIWLEKWMEFISCCVEAAPPDLG